MKTKKMVINAIVAALYIAVTLVVAPLSYGAIQFRLSEIFNHLAVFNKNYIIGIGAGVFIANLFSPLGWYDIVFGLAHTLISLIVLTFLTKHVSNKWLKMSANILLFAFFSFIIAWELKLAFNAPFWLNYGFVAIGEIVVMGIGMPLMKYIDGKVQFNQHMTIQ
ncbi:MAG: QueT transporter family protein [Pisciglobus halotolerans]|nr:QueT transporter family protein [Pisciglobus halotolerans]